MLRSLVHLQEATIETRRKDWLFCFQFCPRSPVATYFWRKFQVIGTGSTLFAVVSELFYRIKVSTVVAIAYESVLSLHHALRGRYEDESEGIFRWQDQAKFYHFGCANI